MTVSVDPSSAAPLRAPGSSSGSAGRLLMPNAAEARRRRPDAPPARRARSWSRSARTGALWSDGGACAPRPVAVVDTTGAGDAFAAGLPGARRRGAEPPEALAAGLPRAAARRGAAGARPQYD